MNVMVKGDLTNPTDLPNHVYQLVQAAQNWDKSNDTCNSCGEKGHWSKDYPTRKAQNPFTSGNQTPGNRKSLRNNPMKERNNGRGGRLHHPIIPPLKKGESKIMKNKLGKTMNWCSKCNKWTYSYSTDGHKTKDELDRQGMLQQTLHKFPSTII